MRALAGKILFLLLLAPMPALGESQEANVEHFHMSGVTSSAAGAVQGGAQRVDAINHKYDRNPEDLNTLGTRGLAKTGDHPPGDMPLAANEGAGAHSVSASTGGFSTLGDYVNNADALANEQARSAQAAKSFQSFAQAEAARHREQASALRAQREELSRRIANLGDGSGNGEGPGSTAQSRGLPAAGDTQGAGSPSAGGASGSPGGGLGDGSSPGLYASAGRGFASRSAMAAYARASGGNPGAGSGGSSGGSVDKDGSTIRTGKDGDAAAGRAKGLRAYEGSDGASAKDAKAREDAKNKKDDPESADVIKAALAKVNEEIPDDPAKKAAVEALLAGGDGSLGEKAADAKGLGFVGLLGKAAEAADDREGAPRPGSFAERTPTSAHEGDTKLGWIPDMESPGLFERVHAAHQRYARGVSTK